VPHRLTKSSREPTFQTCSFQLDDVILGGYGTKRPVLCRPYEQHMYADTVSVGAWRVVRKAADNIPTPLLGSWRLRLTTSLDGATTLGFDPMQTGPWDRVVTIRGVFQILRRRPAPDHGRPPRHASSVVLLLLLLLLRLSQLLLFVVLLLSSCCPPCPRFPRAHERRAHGRHVVACCTVPCLRPMGVLRAVLLLPPAAAGTFAAAAVRAPVTSAVAALCWAATGR
jgi:hypothetical protein